MNLQVKRRAERRPSRGEGNRRVGDGRLEGSRELRGRDAWEYNESAGHRHGLLYIQVRWSVKMNGCIASGPLQKRCWVVILGSAWSETNIRVTELLKKKLCFAI